MCNIMKIELEKDAIDFFCTTLKYKLLDLSSTRGGQRWSSVSSTRYSEYIDEMYPFNNALRLKRLINKFYNLKNTGELAPIVNKHEMAILSYLVELLRLENISSARYFEGSCDSRYKSACFSLFKRVNPKLLQRKFEEPWSSQLISNAMINIQGCTKNNLVVGIEGWVITSSTTMINNHVTDRELRDLFNSIPNVVSLPDESHPPAESTESAVWEAVEEVTNWAAQETRPWWSVEPAVRVNVDYMAFRNSEWHSYTGTA